MEDSTLEVTKMKTSMSIVTRKPNFLKQSMKHPEWLTTRASYTLNLIATAIFITAAQPQIPNYHILLQNNSENETLEDFRHTLPNLKK